MMQLERQKKILDYLNKNRKATTKELSQLLDVSTTTIRTDLNQMDRENLITKTHGGAVYNDRSLDNIELTGRAYFFDERALENQKEKEAIANKAIKLIKNHMCIYLDASSTCYTLAKKEQGYRKSAINFSSTSFLASLDKNTRYFSCPFSSGAIIANAISTFLSSNDSHSIGYRNRTINNCTSSISFIIA